jgi:hypothetical protein
LNASDEILTTNHNTVPWTELGISIVKNQEPNTFAKTYHFPLFLKKKS